MFLEHQISISGLFPKDHGTMKTGVTAAENAELLFYNIIIVAYEAYQQKQQYIADF